MKKIVWAILLLPALFLVSSSSASADWVECNVIAKHPDTAVTGTGADRVVSSSVRTYASVGTDCSFDSHGAKIQFQSPESHLYYFQDGSLGHFESQTFSGTAPESIILTDNGETHYLGFLDGSYSTEGLAIGPATLPAPIAMTHFQIFHWVDASPSPTPSPVVVSIGANPPTGTVTVGTPFTVDVVASSSTTAFNAVQAGVTVSSNLSVTGFANPTSSACNLQYTQTPAVSSLSFAGALFGTSSNSCKVYSLTLTPTASGVGTISFSNGSVKSYADHSELLTGVVNGSYTISAASPSPSPTFSEFTVDSATHTYASTLALGGSKNALITSIFVNGSAANSTYPSSTSWQNTVSLSLGLNEFAIFGTDASNNETATQNITVQRHTLGDINGDGQVDIIDASLFAVDWGKTSNLTYPLSDMNDDQQVNLTDLSILAKLQG